MAAGYGEADLEEMFFCSPDAGRGGQSDQSDVDGGEDGCIYCGDACHQRDDCVHGGLEERMGVVAAGLGETESEAGDALAERVIEIAQAAPSGPAMYVGKRMLLRQFEPCAIEYAVNTLDSLDLSNNMKRKAANLLVHWAEHDALRRRKDASPHGLGESKLLLKVLFPALQGIIKHKDAYVVARRILRSLPACPVVYVEDDLANLAKSAHILSKLPQKVKYLFYGVVDDSISQNMHKMPDRRLRYNHVGNLLSGLEPFTRRHSEYAYGLAEKVRVKDERFILHEIYRNIGSLPPELPADVASFMGRVLDLMPSGGAINDPDVMRVNVFLKALRKAFFRHESYELSCFFSLEKRNFDGAKEPLKFVERLAQILNRSCNNRSGHLVSGSASSRVSRKGARQGAVEDIGWEYLRLSAEVAASSVCDAAGACRDFASQISLFDELDLGDRQVLDAMELYKQAIFDKVILNQAEEKRLRAMLLHSSELWTRKRQILSSYAAAMKKGRVPCPDHLKAPLRADFGVEVEYIWDFRDNQSALYYGTEAARHFSELSRGRTDFRLMGRVAEELHDLGLLERRVALIGGGCGYGTVEITFYDALRRRGYDVSLELVDKSHEMLSHANFNAKMQRIDAAVSEANLETLNHKEMKHDRQVLLTLWGGTFFNWLSRYAVAERYATIFRKRDRMDEAGRYVLQRDAPGGPRLRDVLLIEGETRKDFDYYRSELSKLFLAHGLNSEYSVDLGSLMDEGGFCHTLYLDERNPEKVELQCIYLVTKDTGPFRRGEAILVIDSGIMHRDEFEWKMHAAGFDCRFVEGDDSKLVSLCTIHDEGSAKRGG